MPYKSKMQMKKFFQLEKEGKLKKGTAENWAKETPNKKSLPMRIKKKKLGGEVGYRNGGGIKSKMSKYKMAEGGGVDSGGKDGVKRTGTGEKKPGLKPYKGSGDYDKATVENSGSSYRGKVYVDDPKHPAPTRRTVKIDIKAPTPPPELEDDKKDGGEVKGAGTEISDSVPSKIKKGSFIIPAHIKNKLKKLLTSKPAKLNQGGGIPVNLSKGEQVLAPNDAKKINREMKRNGIRQGINILAPHAKRKYKMR